MSWITDLAGVYGRVLRRAFELLARNWLLPVMVLAYQLILTGVALLLVPLQTGIGLVGGLVGSFVVVFVSAACLSSFLALLGRIIRDGRLTPGELRDSFTLHWGDVLNVGFLLFGLRLIGGFALSPFPYLEIVFGIALLVFLNAVPEVLYLGGAAGPALFVESYRFIGQYWIEWFPPSLLLGLGTAGAMAVLPGGPLGLVGSAVFSLLVSYTFLVRGLLFLELTTSSRRAREFQRRSTS